MAQVFRLWPDHPPVRFISVALRSNAAELVDLIKITNERFGAAQHEVRMPFMLPHAPTDWIAQESLSADEWSAIEDTIATLPYPIKVMPDGFSARFYGPPALAGLV